MHRKKRLSILTLTIVLSVGLLVAACGQPTSETVEPGQPAATEEEAPTAAPPQAGEPVTLIVGFEINEATSMDVHQQYDTPGVMVGLIAYESLTRLRSEDWTKPAPGLAESWDVSEDGLVYTFHLRPNVTFHSGNALTADDVEFSLRRLANKEGPAAWLASDWIEDIEVVDDLTVRITLLFPDASFPMIVASPFHSILDSKTVIEQGGTDAEDAATTDQATPWLDQNSAGTGPFVLKSWTVNDEIVFEANPDYWGGKPQIDRLTIKHTLDPTAAFQMLQRGDLDMLLRLNPDLVELAKEDPNLKVETLANLDTFYWVATCDPTVSEPLSDKRVRQAMALAVDREGIVAAALNGYGTLPPSIIPVGLAGVDPAERLPRDLDRARELLSDAGYEDGFEVTLVYPTSSVWDIVAGKIQSDMAELDITVELEPMDYGLLISRAWEERNLAWALFDWNPDYADVSNWTTFFGLGEDDLFPWVMQCENDLPPALVEASEAILSERDPEKRLEAVKKWQQEMMDFAYASNLYQINEHVAMRKGIDGFGFLPMGYTHWGDLTVEVSD